MGDASICSAKQDVQAIPQSTGPSRSQSNTGCSFWTGEDPIKKARGRQLAAVSSWTRRPQGKGAAVDTAGHSGEPAGSRRNIRSHSDDEAHPTPASPRASTRTRARLLSAYAHSPKSRLGSISGDGRFHDPDPGIHRIRTRPPTYCSLRRSVARQAADLDEKAGEPGWLFDRFFHEWGLPRGLPADDPDSR